MGISAHGGIDAEVRVQTTKVTRTAAFLNAIMWQNKHIGIEAKI